MGGYVSGSGVDVRRSLSATTPQAQRPRPTRGSPVRVGGHVRRQVNRVPPGAGGVRPRCSHAAGIAMRPRAIERRIHVSAHEIGRRRVPQINTQIFNAGEREKVRMRGDAFAGNGRRHTRKAAGLNSETALLRYCGSWSLHTHSGSEIAVQLLSEAAVMLGLTANMRKSRLVQ